MQLTIGKRWMCYKSEYVVVVWLLWLLLGKKDEKEFYNFYISVALLDPIPGNSTMTHVVDTLLLLLYSVLMPVCSAISALWMVDESSICVMCIITS